MQQLESGSLEAEENQVPEVAAQNADQKSPNPQVNREVQLLLTLHSLLIALIVEFSLFPF